MGETRLRYVFGAPVVRCHVFVLQDPLLEVFGQQRPLVLQHLLVHVRPFLVASELPALYRQVRRK